MLHIVINTSDPTDPKYGYWIAYNGVRISGPYTTYEHAERALPRVQSALNNYIELEVKGSTTIQLPHNH